MGAPIAWVYPAKKSPVPLLPVQHQVRSPTSLIPEILLRIFIISVDGGWSQWLDMEPCPVTCGEGTRNQVRFCTNPVPSAGGLDCPGASSQEISCATAACPTQGVGANIPSVGEQNVTVMQL